MELRVNLINSNLILNQCQSILKRETFVFYDSNVFFDVLRHSLHFFTVFLQGNDELQNAQNLDYIVSSIIMKQIMVYAFLMDYQPNIIWKKDIFDIIANRFPIFNKAIGKTYSLKVLFNDSVKCLGHVQKIYLLAAQVKKLKK